MMIQVTAGKICSITGAALVAGDAGCTVTGVSIDSRRVPQGGLFVALPGDRVDGNDYVASAIAAGAAAAAMTREPGQDLLDEAAAAGAALLVCSDGEAFVQSLASWWRDQLDAVVVGVTGSSGKTTTRTMIAAVLGTELSTHSTSGNYNNLIGCPLTILSCPKNAQALVVEMGMSALGEIATLGAIVKPDLGVITNVGVAHLGDLGSRENIARAKSEMVQALRPSGDCDGLRSRIFLWGEGDYMDWIANEVAVPRGVDVVRYGVGQDDDARATNITLDDSGRASACFHLPGGEKVEVSLAIAGEHNVRNALAAAAVGQACGISADHIAAGLAAATGLKNHQQLLRSPLGFTVIDDSYNANTDSMRMGVDTLVATSAARRIACLGDMLDLGPDEALLHAVIGAYVAAKPIDLLLCVGPLSRNIANAARLLGMPSASVYELDTPDQATSILCDILREGDVLLVIASHGTHLETVVDGVMHQC